MRGAVCIAFLLVAMGVLVFESEEGRRADAAPAAAPSTSPTPSPQWVQVPTKGARLIKRTDCRLDLSYRQLRRLGYWHLADATDRVAAFEKNIREGSELWLLDAEHVVMRRALSGAVTPLEGWCISEVEVSDSWIAWVELAPGDDLVQEVEWRLYAAPLDRAALALGEPRLIASALNTQTQRPLFDITGTRLVWLSTTWASQSTVGVSRLLVRRLDAPDEPAELYRSQRGMLTTVSTRGERVVVTEVPRKGAVRTRILVVDLNGRARAAYTVPTRCGLSHWPAWRNGWLAWSPFPDGESGDPITYLRSKSGRVYRSGEMAGDPLFVGGFLFYEAAYTIDGVRAVRLRDMKGFVLVRREKGDRDASMGWQGPYSAPELRHTYYAHRSLDGDPRTNDDNYSLIRIYRVR
jgi:hypothetical protein